MSLHFRFAPSRYLAAMLGVVHGAFLAALPLFALPSSAKLALAAVVLASLAYYLRRDAWLLAPDSCAGLVLEEGAAVLVLRDGTQLSGEIAPDSLVMPLLTVLRLALPGRAGTRSVTILPDSMSREAFRQLRVWLKWGRSGHAVVGRHKHGGFG